MSHTAAVHTAVDEGRERDLSDGSVEKARSLNQENTVSVMQIYWMPTGGPDTPHWRSEIEYRTSSDRSRPPSELDEGLKRTAQEVCIVADGDECLMCGSGLPWSECCKAAHAQRLRHAARKLNARLLQNTWDPLSEQAAAQLARAQGELSAAEVALINVLPATDPRRHHLNPMAQLKCSPTEVNEIALQLPEPGHYEEFVARLCDCPLFFPTSSTTFEYISPGPICSPLTGIATFGQVELEPSERRVLAHCLTARRATALIAELRHMCQDLCIAAPCLTVQPFYQAKLEKELLQRNAALLGQGLGEEVRLVVDEGQYRDIIGGRDRCSFCDHAGAEAKKMLRCGGCMSKWYCDATCQKKHWKLHKAECKAAQAARNEKVHKKAPPAAES
jgi:hypothetical protein